MLYLRSSGLAVDETLGRVECTGPCAATCGVPGATGTWYAWRCRASHRRLARTSGWTDRSVDALRSGRPLPGTDLKLVGRDRDGNGELRVRGRHVFMGYWNDPEETQSVMDSDGYLILGEVGKLDEHAYVAAPAPASVRVRAHGRVSGRNLVITGRIREMLVTSTGVSVAPVRIEQDILSAIPILRCL